MKLKMLSFSWKSFVSDNVISVTLMTAIWEITVLDNHSPLITSVRPSTLYFLYIDANWVEKRDDYAIWKWFVEVSDNAIKIMADMLVDIEDLDVWVAERARNKAIELMEKYRGYEKLWYEWNKLPIDWALYHRRDSKYNDERYWKGGNETALNLWMWILP